MVTIRAYKSDDWPAVERIYAQGIATGLATFEKDTPSQESWQQDSIPDSQIVAADDAGEVIGWAALWPTSDRCCYRGVAEVSVYVGEMARGKGVGRALVEGLISISERRGFWTLQAGIIRGNDASVILHEKCGFRLIGFREKVGQIDGVWYDTLLLERRSTTVGV